MTAEHSPAPWKIQYNTDGWGADEDDLANRYIERIESADGHLVYYTESGYFKGNPADVVLIAAAPDLLAACREFIDAHDKGLAFSVSSIRAAIAKATGTAS